MVDSIRSKFAAATCTANAPIDQSMGPALNQDIKGSLSKLAHANDVVVLGDTNHETLGTKWFVQNNVVETLAKSGVKTIYLEMDPNDQKKIDAFTSGKMSAEQFTTEVSSTYNGGETDLTDLITQAKKNGVKVVAADSIEAGKAAQAAGKLAMMADVMGTDTAEGAEYLKKSHEKLKERMDLDVDLARKINDTRGDEKAAVIFGANHGRTENGLMDNLRGKSAKIDIYGNTAEESKETLKEDLAIGALARKPDAIFIDSKSTVYATCNTPPQLAQDLEAVGQQQAFANANQPIEPMTQRKVEVSSLSI